MQHCPTCNRTYPEDAPAFCPHDAARLVSDAVSNNQRSTQSTPLNHAPSSSASQQLSIQPTTAHGGLKPKGILILLVVLLLLVGTGAGFYLLNSRSSKSYSSYNSSSNSSSSGSSNSTHRSGDPTTDDFAGTWKPETSGTKVDTLTINVNGTYTIEFTSVDGDPPENGHWSGSGDEIELRKESGKRTMMDLGSDNRLSGVEGGKRYYFVKS